jgi:hypothetical protein
VQMAPAGEVTEGRVWPLTRCSRKFFVARCHWADTIEEHLWAANPCAPASVILGDCTPVLVRSFTVTEYPI